jgi:hypothetical protein
MSLEAVNIVAKITGQERITGDLDSTYISIADRSPIGLPNGTGAGQVDRQWSDTRTVGTSGETLDLNALTDSLGRTINFAKVKAVFIQASALNSSTIVIGNAGSNQFQMGFGGATNIWTLAAGDFLFVAAPNAGWPSTNSTSDNLKITGGAAGQIYDIVLVGTSS